MSKKILLVADVDGMFYHSATTTIEESILKFRDKFQNMLEKTGCTDYIAFYSKGKYFRHNISESYKANRTNEPPIFMKALKEWAIVEFGLQTSPMVEADDLVTYWGNIKNWDKELTVLDYVPDEIIITSPDKDIINSIPGRHFNYSYKIKEESKVKQKEDLTEDDIDKGYWIETSEYDSKLFKYMQVLMGDSTDGISGIPKVGPVKAKKIVEPLMECDLEQNILYGVIGEYVNYYGNISIATFEFQKNYRLLHMLSCPSEFISEVGSLPEQVKIINVKSEVKELEINTEF